MEGPKKKLKKMANQFTLHSSNEIKKLDIRGKNDFAEESKILLDTSENNFCWTIKIILLEP